MVRAMCGPMYMYTKLEYKSYGACYVWTYVHVH